MAKATIKYYQMVALQKQVEAQGVVLDSTMRVSDNQELTPTQREIVLAYKAAVQAWRDIHKTDIEKV